MEPRGGPSCHRRLCPPSSLHYCLYDVPSYLYICKSLTSILRLPAQAYLSRQSRTMYSSAASCSEVCIIAWVGQESPSPRNRGLTISCSPALRRDTLPRVSKTRPGTSVGTARMARPASRFGSSEWGVATGGRSNMYVRNGQVKALWRWSGHLPGRSCGMDAREDPETAHPVLSPR